MNESNGKRICEGYQKYRGRSNSIIKLFTTSNMGTVMRITKKKKEKVITSNAERHKKEIKNMVGEYVR